jgi:hypothetical protein
MMRQLSLLLRQHMARMPLRLRVMKKLIKHASCYL